MTAKPITGLTLTFGEKNKNLSVDALREALQHAVEMLKSLEPEFVSSGTEVRWEVSQIRMNSPLTVVITPDLTGRRGLSIAKKMVKAAAYDIGAIERNGVVPKHFSEDGLLALKSMVALSHKENAPIKLGLDKKSQITLTDQSVRRVNEIVEKARLYIDFSTIEGHLDTVSVHGGRTFIIWETLTNNRIECTVSEELFSQWKDLLGKRVAITGRVHYRNHVPKRIVGESIRELREASQLPQPKNMVPINITDGLPSEEHVRRIRNG